MQYILLLSIFRVIIIKRSVLKNKIENTSFYVIL